MYVCIRSYKNVAQFRATAEDVFDGCQHVQILGSSIHSTLEGWRSYQAQWGFCLQSGHHFCCARSQHGRLLAGELPADKNAMDILFEPSIEIVFMIIMSKLISYITFTWISLHFCLCLAGVAV